MASEEATGDLTRTVGHFCLASQEASGNHEELYTGLFESLQALENPSNGRLPPPLSNLELFVPFLSKAFSQIPGSKDRAMSLTMSVVQKFLPLFGSKIISTALNNFFLDLVQSRSGDIPPVSDLPKDLTTWTFTLSRLTPVRALKPASFHRYSAETWKRIFSVWAALLTNDEAGNKSALLQALDGIPAVLPASKQDLELPDFVRSYLAAADDESNPQVRFFF